MTRTEATVRGYRSLPNDPRPTKWLWEVCVKEHDHEDPRWYEDSVHHNWHDAMRRANNLTRKNNPQ